MKLVVVGIAWFALGLLDFGTGFVGFSPLRLLLLVLIAPLLLWPSFLTASVVARVTDHLNRRPVYALGFLAVLVFLGYALFLSRYLHGANMADDAVFMEVIDQTARGCFLCYAPFGGSYFAGHNNLFLILFAPLTALPNWWLFVHLVQSAVIVIWCRVCGWSLGGETRLGWYLTGALFLATYTQHAAFYDARFTALALAFFALGFYLQRRRLMLASALAALPTRETSGLTLFAFGLIGALTQPQKRLLIAIAVIGLLWWIGSYGLMLRLGGPIVPRFDACLRLTLSALPDSSCLLGAITTDWQLKTAYTLRLLRFAPILGALPSFLAAMPDFVFTWLSKDNVLYSLGWHYYMQTLGVLIVGAGLVSRRDYIAPFSENLLARWIASACLWQFVTTVRPNLF